MADRWTSQTGQQEGRNLNVNDKYRIRREKRERKKKKKEKKDVCRQRDTHGRVCGQTLTTVHEANL